MRFWIFKGGPGSGDHGHKGRPGQVGGSAPADVPVLPSSAGITTKDQAQAYWNQHFADRTLSLNVKTKSGIFTASVTFKADSHHAWTKDADGAPPDVYDRPKTKDGPRIYDPKRAVFMDRLLQTISRPWRVLAHHGDHLFLGARTSSSETYLVILKINTRQNYNFVSAYPKTNAELGRIYEEWGTVKPKGKLQKSETLPVEGRVSYSALRALLGKSLSRSSEGEAHYHPDIGRPNEVNEFVARFFDIFKALAPGERWITVKPPGHDKGVPVIVKPTSDGAMKVIGGAGGKLSHLRLTGVKSEAEYTHEARQKAALHKDARKRQAERDRKDGLTASKAKAREALKAQLQDHQAKFVSQVADALGWTPEQMQFPAERFAKATPEAQAKAAKQHAAAVFKAAQDAVKQQRQRLVQDAEARSQAGLGEVPLTTSDPEALTVQDLDPIAPATKGLGYATNYDKRAAKAGLTPEGLAEQAAAAKPQGEAKPADAAGKHKEMADRVATELKAIQEPGPALKPNAPVDAKKVVELLKAEKALRAVRRDAAEKGKQIDAARAPVEPKAYVLEQGGPVEESAVTRDLESDLRTLRTRAFLDEVGKLGAGQDSLGKHIGVGAFNSINAVALAAGGGSLVDRSVVDVLGVAGAAQVLARRLGSDLPHGEMDTLREAMGTFHVEHYMALSDQAIREARDWQEMAKEIDVGEGATGHDLAVAQELNARRREFTDHAQRTLGTALGEMEANAALVAALDNPGRKDVQASLGRTTIENAIKQAHAIGLDKGDFTVERAGASTILTVHGSGLDKLAQPVARVDMLHTRQALDIMEGRADEEDWLPEGVARRPEMAMNAQPGVAPRLAKPFSVGSGGVERAIKDYIGGRTADGDAPADVMAGLLSEDTLRKAGDRDAFMAVLDRVAPLHGQDGSMIRAEAHGDAFNKMADAFTERAYGLERTPLHRQQFKVDQVAVNALHAALAKHPAGPAAFKPVGDLTPQDQRALRDVFAAEHGRVDAGAAAAQEKLAKLDQSEPAKTAKDMFGGEEANPEHAAWKAERDGLAEKVNAATMSWGKYLDVMGSPAKAYAATQDVLKGRVLDEFARQHNLHRPGAPLRTGRTVIAGDLNHLDALDSKAREQRLAEHRDMTDRLRSRVAGKYAAGSVSDKLDAARAADEAVSQSQMGMFGSEDPAPSAAAPEKPMALGERRSIGHAAEQQVAGMMPIVGRNFQPGQPVPLWQPTMSGKYVGRQRAVKLIEHDKRIALGLGVGCVDGDTVLDDAEGRGMTFGEWWLSGERPVVLALDNAGKQQLQIASPVFAKSVEPMVRVAWSEGRITVAANHVFLTHRGWVKAADLTVGDDLVAGGPQSERLAAPLSLLPIGALQALRDGLLSEESAAIRFYEPVCARHYHGKAEDCSGGCWRGFHPCDAQPLQAEDSALTSFPSPADALGHSLSVARGDDLAGKLEYNRVHPHTDLQSNYDFSSLVAQLSAHEEQYHASSALAALSAHPQQGLLQSEPQTDPHQIIDEEPRRCEPGGPADMCANSAAQAQRPAPATLGEWFWATHPNDALDKLDLALRERRLRSARMVRRGGSPSVTHRIVGLKYLQAAPVFDLHVPFWHNYSAEGVVHHNSGKTAIMLGAFTHLKAKGKANRAIFAVPSIVQGQFGAEAQTLLEAGKFNWHANPGASREERLAALKDPKVDFNVVTHQALRDDVLHLAAQQDGTTPDAVAKKLEGMSQPKRRDYMRGVLDKEGIHHDYMAVDEGHSLLNRAGKENSRMANTLDAVADGMGHYVNATADPVKNDPSEAFSVLQKMDPARYTDRDAFLRKYGVDTEAARDGLRREMARHFYTGRIDPGVKANKTEIKVELSPQQHERLRTLDQAANAGRAARMGGKVDVAAMRTLSPGSFDGVPADKHEELAKTLQDSLGILLNTAKHAAIDGGAKTEALSKIAADRRGRPGVVFAHRLSSVNEIADRLKKEGHRVVTLTGGDSSAEKDRKKRAYQAGEHDIMVASDAGAVGANLQRGKFLVQYDSPNTSMLWNQRNGRIHRVGQSEDVELFDLVANHPVEARARKRLATKGELREIMTSPLEGLDDSGLAGQLSRVRAINNERNKAHGSV